MIRLIHAQTVSGAILVDDIDDGLPNKAFHRLGATADPKAYDRETAAGAVKQPCYVPVTSANTGFPLVSGYIDLLESQRVVHSEGKGKIQALVNAGLVSSVNLVAADVALPTLVTVDEATPGAGDATLTGTNLISVAPDVTTVVFTGTGAITLTADFIAANGGTANATTIVIPAALFTNGAINGAGATSAQITANQQVTALVASS